jgi:hypothetical protein
MYDALMAVKPEGLSLNRWAQRAGINRSIFNGIRAHGNPTTQTLDKLLAAIGVDPGDFRARLQPVRPRCAAPACRPTRCGRRGPCRDGQARPAARHRVRQRPRGDRRDRDHRADAERGARLSRAAASLANDDDAYAVTMIGDSMAPRFEPGEIAFVSPKAPVNVGDDVLVQLRAAEPTKARTTSSPGGSRSCSSSAWCKRTSTESSCASSTPTRPFECRSRACGGCTRHMSAAPTLHCPGRHSIALPR